MGLPTIRLCSLSRQPLLSPATTTVNWFLRATACQIELMVRHHMILRLGVSGVDIMSALLPMSILSRSDTACKCQQIGKWPSICTDWCRRYTCFPKAKCKGQCEWLDKWTFVWLALSWDGHKNFDGSANGQGSLVVLEPITSHQIETNYMPFTSILNSLWCQN